MPRPMGKHRACSKKVFPEFVRTVQQVYAPDQVEFWAMDEHSIGLKLILRRTWSRRGQRPVVLFNHRYAWSYGFVQPRTGRSFWLLMPTVSIAAFSAALHEFANFCDAGRDKHIFLPMECAGWHTSRRLDLPAGLHP